MDLVGGVEYERVLPLELRVLGSFHVRLGDTIAPAPTRQVARVATVLAGWPGEPVARERIMTALWGESPPTTATNTLQVHISHLRRLLGKDVVRSLGNEYVLDVPPEAVDAEQFVEAIAEAVRMRRREHFGRAAEILTQALGIWRGTPFPDIADPDLEARRSRLTELRDAAREDLLECRLELAMDQFALADVVAEGRELVSRQPLRERGHGLLVRALAAADRPSEASAAFESAVRQLRTTMGLDPGRELVTVYGRTLNQSAEVYPKAMRAISHLPVVRHLPERLLNLAQRAREAVVDLGASTVTVLHDDGADVVALSAAVSRALLTEMSAGVMVIDERHASIRAISAMLREATESDDEVTLLNWPSRANLALVVCTSDLKRARQLCMTLNQWAEAPRLVFLSARPFGFDTEVVITERRRLPRSAPADALAG